MKITVKEVADVYGVLKSASYAKLADEDKVKVWKSYRNLRDIAEQFTADVKDASEKLLPYPELVQDLQKARQWELSKDKEGLEMTEEEYKEFLVKWLDYQKMVEEAVKDLGDKPVEVQLYPLSEEGFERLLSSNKWTFGQVEKLEVLMDKN